MKTSFTSLAAGLTAVLIPLQATSQPAAADGIGLQELVKAVTEELHAAAADRITDDRPALFKLGKVTLELSFVASREVGARGGIRFWVIEAGTEAQFASESVQRVTVVLDPIEMDEEDMVLFRRRQAEEMRERTLREELLREQRPAIPRQ
jgi:hypothetical protein